MATTMLIVCTSSSEYLKMSCCHTYRPQPIEHVRETMLRIIHRNASTLTSATLINASSTQEFLVFIRHPELNSRDVIPCHNSRNATCLTPILSSTQGIRSEPPLKEHQQVEL
ncbi:hypothetical protein DEO72_LG4g1167 [Vigna unguiculata]|uniref:Uncharacterized protein n=1 Tax=Vigna unguiculata TaxID=3917 RepID=A0A4D6LN02_VIGUN|nr:hypothetical protein DEO72_LG4g1167 [Vigna unguiculata]